MPMVQERWAGIIKRLNLKIDDKIQQKYNDCVHFKHTIYLSEDEDRKSAAEIRYDVAWDDVITLRSELDPYIFG